MVDEVAREGIKELARFLNCCERTAWTKAQAMKEIGAVFEQLRGRPPRKVIMWFPSVVKSYMAAEQRARIKRKGGCN